MTTDAIALGTAYAEALGAKDFPALQALLADDVDFRALTPRKPRQAASSDAVVPV